ncbi:MAG TPA: bifunctional homocysteine S-methyltransferase/methylenetetrahydrofolate reductase [Chloroflexi bacterium]|nr:bifunctional homocysteine S-methyltransferase/methylenetetrahydrofolate reductase [Chloroflexota bacterium]
MAANRFLKLLSSSTNPIVFDGAMGTMLHTRGESFEGCLDELNLSNPGLVAEIHRAYIEAGAQVIMTNTFGANHFKLSEHGLENQLHDIICAGANLAQKVVEASFKPVLIAGDVGPLGIRLAPFGRVTPEQARQVFAEQIKALADCDVDLIVIETISDLYEMREAVLAARQVCDLPVLASITFTRDDRTLLGDHPKKAAEWLHAAGADLIGVNCSEGPAQVLRIMRQMRQALPDGRFSVMPNAGWPERVGGRIMYPAGPEYFGDYAVAFRQAGVDVIGGCCGTTPEHIKAMRTALETTLPEEPAELPALHEQSSSPAAAAEQEPSHLARQFLNANFALCVEMDPPRGLSIHKLLAGASLLQEAGADVINVADSPMARMRMSPWAVCELLQNQVGIETTLHFPTRGRNLLRVQGDLLAAHAIGVRNIFVVMGDPTEIGDYPEAMDNYDLAPSGLVKLIKQGFNTGVDHAGLEIGEPTNFYVGSALNLTPKDIEREVKVLRRKLSNGADFFLTQPVYEPEKALRFLKRYAEEYGDFDHPILVGVLPLYNLRHTNFLHHEVPGIQIPDWIQERIRKAGDDSAREGIRIAVEQIEQIKEWGQGIYLMPPFNRFEIAAEIIEQVKS